MSAPGLAVLSIPIRGWFAGFITEDVLRNPTMLLGDRSKR